MTKYEENIQTHILVLGRPGIGKTRFINTCIPVCNASTRFYEDPFFCPEEDSVICNGLIILIDSDFDKSKNYIERNLATILCDLENFPRENVASVILNKQQNFRKTLEIIKKMFRPFDGNVFVLDEDSCRLDQSLIDYLLYLNCTNKAEFRFKFCLDDVSVFQIIGNIFEALIDALYCIEENVKRRKENRINNQLTKRNMDLRAMKCSLQTICKKCLSQVCRIGLNNLGKIGVRVNENGFCTTCLCPPSEHIIRLFSPKIESLPIRNREFGFMLKAASEKSWILHLLANLCIFSQQNCREVIPEYLKDFNNRTLWSQVRGTYVEDKMYQRIEAAMEGRSNNININEVVKCITEFIEWSKMSFVFNLNKDVPDIYVRPTYNLQIIQNKEATNSVLDLHLNKTVSTHIPPEKGGDNSKIDTKPKNKSDAQTKVVNSDGLMTSEFENTSTHNKLGAIPKERTQDKNTPTDTTVTAKNSPNPNQIENAINIKTLITAISEIRSELGEIKKFITNSEEKSSSRTINDSDVKSGDASSVLETLQTIHLADLKAIGDLRKDLTDLKNLGEMNQAMLIKNSAELKLQIDDLAKRGCNKCGADENFDNSSDNSKKFCDDNKEFTKETTKE